MPRFIVTFNYTAAAMKAMVAKPSDREAAARAVVESAGGKLESVMFTTGASDVTMVVTIGEVTDLIAGLMAVGSAGTVTNIQTQRAFTSAEFTAMQKKAAQLAKAYAPPG